MLVFWEQRLAFLATPKTGSTAIAAALEPLAPIDWLVADHYCLDARWEAQLPS